MGLISPLSLLLLVTLLAGPAFKLDARIGETLAQCEERYGPVIEVGYAGTSFKKNGIDIKVDFYKRKVIKINYWNSEASFSEAELKKLLEFNHPKNDWVLKGGSFEYSYCVYKAEHIKAVLLNNFRSGSIKITAKEKYFITDTSAIEGF